MSLRELTACEDFLKGHRDYAMDLFSNVEKMRQWHRRDDCSETREGRVCTLCELCSLDGLFGAATKALAACEDAENHLKRARASLGQSAPRSRSTPSSHSQFHSTFIEGPGSSNQEALFKSNLAKAVFLCVATVGDNLRTQHVTWQARLQSEVADLSSSAHSFGHTNVGLGNLGEKNDGEPTNSGTKHFGLEANPGLPGVPPGWIPDPSSSSSTVVVFRRCLSGDCPCDANRANAASNANLRGTYGSQVFSGVSPSLDSNKKHRSKAAESAALNRSRKASDKFDALTQGNPDARRTNTQILEDVMLGEHELRGPAPDTIQDTGSPSPPTWDEAIEDPRVFNFRALIMQSDNTCQALTKWCRTWMADLQLEPQRMVETERINESARDTHEYPSITPHSSVDHKKSLCMTDQVEEVSIIGNDDETGAQNIHFNCEQEELMERWLSAQQRRCKNRKGRSRTLLQPSESCGDVAKRRQA